MTLSFHVQTIPCPEEYYMGVQASADAYFVEVPDELFPKELMNVLKYKKGLDGKLSDNKGWYVMYDDIDHFVNIYIAKSNLIDACVEMIVWLKENEKL